jgi:hypothetical protein
MERYEEDRLRQRERAAREKTLRQGTVAATPLPHRSSGDPMPRRSSGGAHMHGNTPLMGAQQAAVWAPSAEAAPDHADARAQEFGVVDYEESTEEEGALEREDEDVAAAGMHGMHGRGGAGLRQRFPGQGNRLGGTGE